MVEGPEEEKVKTELQGEVKTEVVQATPTKKEDDRGGTTLAIIFGIMLLVGFIFLGDFNNYVLDLLPPEIATMFNLKRYVATKELNNRNMTTSDDSSRTTNTNINTKYKINGIYEVSKKTNGEADTGYLSIRNDGTFAYDSSLLDCYNPLVGTYKINDRNITFTVSVVYGCDSCFSKKVPVGSDFSATINDDNTIIIEESYLGALVSNEYKKNSSKVESSATKNKYALLPVNGTIPDENNESWLECSK